MKTVTVAVAHVLTDPQRVAREIIRAVEDEIEIAQCSTGVVDVTFDVTISAPHGSL